MKRSLIAVIALVLILITNNIYAQLFTEQTIKFGRTLALIDAYYVDSTNQVELTEKAIIELLLNLDPHSVYISKEDLQEVNEKLEGSFEGVGIEFNVLHDSILVIAPMPGGPSEKAGLRPGDRIVNIDGENVASIGITTSGVRKRLLGDKGTLVQLGIFRKGGSDITNYTITRDKLPVNSVLAVYMANEDVGYLKLSNFSLTTEKEFNIAVDKLLSEGMKHMVLDLRGNVGGYLEAAIRLCDHFFSDEKLIVYLEGLKTPRQDLFSRKGGKLNDSRLIIIVDEGSASASEIMAGAVQDWDRGLIIGRRSFGKGLVQNAFNLGDGSIIRLTIARYYTPVGRLIQRSYDEGTVKYMTDYFSRYSNGEMVSADSIHFNDSLKFSTLINKRMVFGGGGIMPDVFLPLDTSWYSNYYRDLLTKNVITEFSLEYIDMNRESLLKEYSSFNLFSDKFSFSDKEVDSFIKRGEEMGIEFKKEEFEKSGHQIRKILKALIARDIWDMSEYYEIMNENNQELENALRLISNEEEFNSLLQSGK